MGNKRLPIIAILLVLSIGNYARIEGTEHIRLIEFVSIFTIGVLSGLLLHTLVTHFKNRS